MTADATCCPVVELRQYRLHPGRRDTLIELFEREFVESQEAAGIQLIAQFRDIDQPDIFTWLRGFPDMESRAAALTAFYDGPVWAQFRDAANATMISSDNVRLLRPVRRGSGFVLGERASIGAAATRTGFVIASIYTLAPHAQQGFNEFFQGAVAPRLRASGARPFALFETEPSANTFPRLPVREGEHAFVWFARFDGVADYEQHTAALARDPFWTGEVEPELARRLVAPTEIWRLAPTARSRTLD